jgi:drug/metabolite transporter (DMT)-like permease
MGHLSPVIVGVGLLTQPVAAAVIGWFAYRESFGLTDLVGAILICIAMVLIRLPGPKLASDAVEDHGEKS